MAGFAVLVAPDLPPPSMDEIFQNLVQLTASYKQLDNPAAQVREKNCRAVKLDSPASIHRGIVRDHQTGSWLLAAGTVVALEGDNDPNTSLLRLLRDYIDRGSKALDRYDGHFTLVIYNGLDEGLSVVADPIGLFSIFYCQRGRQVLISSSVLAIATKIQAQTDILAVEHFLRTGRLDGDKTLWQDIKRLPGGMVLRTTPSGIEIEEYWSPTFNPFTAHLSFEEALDQSADLLTQTFSRILPREGKTWVDLTGGFDSRLVAMLAAKTQVPFSVYCMGPEDQLDVQLSRKIGEEMKWEYVNTQLPEQWEADQYSWFTSALGCGDGRASLLRTAVTIRGFKERNIAIKTNVMGVGGENWRGFSWQIEKGNIGKTTRLNYEALLDNKLSAAFPVGVMRYDRTAEVRQELSDYIHQLCLKYAELPNTVQIDRFEIGRDANHGGAYLSSVTGVERSLAPLCFKAPVNFAFSLNYLWKYPRHHLLVRALLERENKRLADMETTTGGPAIPIRLTNVHRFWPLWKEVTNRAVAIGTKKILGKSLQIWPQFHSSAYPLPSWRTAFFTYARSEGMLNIDTMITGNLYKPADFIEYVKRTELDPQQSSEFVDRVISVEMAMRAVGSLIN